jgi:hypothetical protein
VVFGKILPMAGLVAVPVDRHPKGTDLNIARAIALNVEPIPLEKAGADDELDGVPVAETPEEPGFEFGHGRGEVVGGAHFLLAIARRENATDTATPGYPSIGITLFALASIASNNVTPSTAHEKKVPKNCPGVIRPPR